MNIVGNFLDAVHLFAQEVGLQEIKELKKKSRIIVRAYRAVAWWGR
jgi:hypothetical protein